MTRNTKNETPPTSVAIAAWLFLAYGRLSFSRILVFGGGPPATPGAMLAWLFVLAYFIFMARSLYVGRNWVRWLLALIVAIAIVVIPLQKPDLPDWPELGIYVLQLVMPIVSSALTFTRQARIWFQT